MESFNYISFGNWENVEGNADVLTMPRDRVFEYTPSDMEQRLESLNEAVVAFLERLPTFLCSEIKRTRSGLSMIIKYGRISKITPGRKEVSMTFETLIDFGEVTFNDIETPVSVFGSYRLQLFRTHWAVQENDAQKVLSRLAKCKTDLRDKILSHQALIAAGEAIRPPRRSKNILGEAKSVEGFLQLLYNSPGKPSTETFFRGHSDQTYELTPSLLRKSDNGDWQFMPREDRLCKELLIAHYDEFQDDQYCFDRLVRMQHYGLPTRLLDISGNPLVALFFACYGKPEASGEAIVFQIASNVVKYYDSDTVSCLSNLSNLTFAQKNEIDLSLDLDAFNKTDVIEKLVHHIRSEKSFFKSCVVPDDLGSIVCVKAKQSNTRIKSQSGAFLLFGQEPTLPEAGQNGIEISRITISEKEHILAQLDRININAKTVYPSIEQTAFHLRQRLLSLSVSSVGEQAGR